jgi:hypothetical protein
MVELLQVQAHIAKIRLRRSERNISVVRRALDTMQIPEVSFSDDEDDVDVDCMPGVISSSDSDSEPEVATGVSTHTGFDFPPTSSP